MGFVKSIFPTALYAILVWTTAWLHEPWADEAQAWLIARDSSLPDLWTRLLHYEGTPGLWHTLLWMLHRMAFPYSALNFLSAAFGVAAAYLVFRYAPFALPIRLLLPFTYFLAYQYAVVARSYVLIPPLLFSIAILHSKRDRLPTLYLALLCALALCSLHGLVLSAALALATFRRRTLFVYTCIAALGAWAAFPAADVTFVRHLNYSSFHLFGKAGLIVSEAFAGNWIVSLVLIALSAPFLWRGGSLLLFVFSALALIVLMAVVYGQVWHFGMIFLAWIVSLWIAALRARPGWMANWSLFTVLAIHGYWTVGSVYEEARTAYSGSSDAARYLAGQQLPQSGLYGIGYASVAVQPYFDRNIFTNFSNSFWDWSSQNHMIRDYDKLEEARPPWVLVGYKTREEDYLWNTQVRRSGYRRVKHFDGHVIWKGKQFEPESFDLYQSK